MKGLVFIALFLAISIYFITQIIRDFRRGDRAMALFGIACVLTLWLTPISTHAVKLDLPPPPNLQKATE